MFVCIIIGLIYNLIGFYVLLAVRCKFCNEDDAEPLNPVWWYKNSDLNELGSIMATLCYFLLCPLWAIGWWFYKLCIILCKRGNTPTSSPESTSKLQSS